MVQRKHIKKQTVKICQWFWCRRYCNFENKTEEINNAFVNIGFETIFSEKYFPLLYLWLSTSDNVLPLDRSSCDVLSVFRQAYQSAKWLEKASSFISQLVWVLLVFASWMADSLDCSIMSFALDGTATLKRSMCLNPLLYACTHQPPWCCGLSE